MKANYWLEDENRYFLAYSKTTDVIPPGAYYIDTDHNNKVFLRNVSLTKDSICLSCNPLIEKVNNEIKNFWNSKEKYDNLNITHKRGVLLYGPPGTGKSVILRSVIYNHCKDKIAIIVRNEAEIFLLLDLLEKINQKFQVLLCIEDIDNILIDDVNISNLLDGTTNMNTSVVTLATTNYIQKIPDRIVNRPSRIDLLYYVGPPTQNEIKEYLKYLYPAIPSKIIETFSKKLTGYSLAHVKEAGLAYAVYNKTINEIIDRFKQTNIIINSPKQEEEI